MNTKTVYVGIMTREAYRQRTLAIARGEYHPRKHEPEIWFESLKSMAQILSNENRALLKIILDKKPASLAELEALSGRKKSNLSRTLKRLEGYGIVTLHREKNRVVAEVMATEFKVSFDLDDAIAA